MHVTSLDDWISRAKDTPRSLRGRRVFLRADLNVPLDGNRVRDDTRIRASLGTLTRLLNEGASVILASHLGRPKGQVNPSLSLAPVAARLSELIPNPVHFIADCIGKEAQTAAAALSPGEVLVLENLRFHPGETENDPKFAEELAQLAEAYVNDAFGTAHRAHASTVGIVHHLPDAVAGDLLRAELSHLGVVLEPQRPLLCLLGGAKVSDKMGVLRALSERADVLAIGGAMAYTFLAAKGHSVGQSLVETDRIDDSLSIMEAAKTNQCKLLLPTDHVIARGLEEDSETRIESEIPEGWMGVDIGPMTATAYAHEAKLAQTIMWNGPMGVFEIVSFASGTREVAQAVAGASATSVVGGGDSLAAINQLELGDQINHLSTGGGASLEFIQGLTLPGVAALEK